MGYDDPIYYMNTVKPELIDFWLAYHLLEQEGDKQMRDPTEAFDRLFKGSN
jgi:hypothetical protein